MLRFVSYNCHSVRTNIDIVKQLLSSHDVVLLQELMLPEEDIAFIDMIDSNFYSVSHVKDKKSDGIIVGRPSRGVAILWRKCLSFKAEVMNISDRMIGVSFSGGSIDFLILNVYMPYDARDIDSLDEYRNCLGILEGVVEEAVMDNVVIVGDFNADNVKLSRFWKELNNFTRRSHLIAATSTLPSSEFTYLCPASSSTSFIDHIICNQRVLDLIGNISILYNFSLYDHFPLRFELNVNYDKITYVNKEQNSSLNNKINWQKLNNKQIKSYRETTRNFFNDSITDHEVFICNDVHCKSTNHIAQLDAIYLFLVNLFLFSSRRFVNCSKVKTFSRGISGWNEYVRDYYRDARNKFLKWKYFGRKEDTVDHCKMLSSRARFRRAFRYCKYNKVKIENEKLASSLSRKKYKDFWKNVKSRKNLYVNNSVKIDNETDPLLISEKFSSFFRDIFADQNFTKSTCNEQFDFNDISNNDFNRFHTDDIIYAVKCLKPYSGIDGIHSYHLKYSPVIVLSFVAEFFTSCIKHAHIPCKITEGIITPLLKDKFADNFALKNYRPIIQSTVILKTFEYVILNKIKKFFTPSDCQHGFRNKDSTITAGFVLKETILAYMTKNTPVYTAFLDLSKAFDKVNFNILFRKLYENNIPLIYIRLISNLYNNQNVRVKFNNVLSDSWRLSNGVRQGGILSPFLFNIYINDLIKSISSSQFGCKLGIVSSNIIAYADDLTILAPSVTGLQNLLNQCYHETEMLMLKFNSMKSVCMKFSKNMNEPVLKKKLKLGCNEISFVEKTMYLGFNIDSNLCNKNDIIKERNKFYNNFNCILRKFNNVSFNVFLTLFKAYCYQFYGSELWFNNFNCKIVIHQFSVGFHKAIKKMIGAPWRESNHIVCKMTGMVTFEHILDINRIRFLYKILKYPPKFIENNFSFFINSSFLMNEIEFLIMTKYNVDNFLDNDLDALIARIFYVHDQYIFNIDRG